MKVFLLLLLPLIFAASSAAAEVPQYDLRIEIEPEKHRIRGNGTILLPPSDSVQQELKLALSELMNDFQAEVLEPVESAGPVKTSKQLRPYSRPGWGTNTWTLSPPKPIPAHVPVRIHFSYSGVAGRTSFIFYIGDTSFAGGIATAWYPQLEESPRTDDGIRLKGFRGIGSLRFKVPEGYFVYAPGFQKQTDEKEYQFAVQTPIYFSFGAGKYYTLQEKSPRNLYLHQLRDRPQMQSYLSGCGKILDVLSAEFGAYPFPDFAVVEVPSDKANEAGFAGASLDGFMLATSDFLNQEFNTAYYGHEIGHQWWGGMIRSDGISGRWMLSEGMAQYGSLRAVESIEGPEKAETYRRSGYPGYLTDHSGFGYLMLLAAGLDLPLAELPADGYLPRHLADSKGFIVWRMLAREVGEEVFREFLHGITKEWAWRRIPWDVFLNELEKRSGKRLQLFYDSWFRNTAVPRWKSNWKQERNNLTLEILQEPSSFKQTVNVEVRGTGCNKIVRPVRIDGGKSVATIAIPFRAIAVELDPDFQVLHWTDDYFQEAKALVAYTLANHQLMDGKTQEAVGLFEESIKNLTHPDTHGLQFRLHYGYSQALMDLNRLEDARKNAEAALRSPVRRADLLPWVYLHLATLAEKLNDSALFCYAYRSTVASDLEAGGHTGAAQIVKNFANASQCE